MADMVTLFLKNLIRKKIKLTSVVWHYFERTGRATNGIERAVCKECKKLFTCGSTTGHQGKKYETSHLQHHIGKYTMPKICDLSQMFINQEGKLQSRKIDQWIQRGILVEAILKHNFSYSFVEYDGIKTWVNYISADVMLPSRNTCVADVKSILERKRN